MLKVSQASVSLNQTGAPFRVKELCALSHVCNNAF